MINLLRNILKAAIFVAVGLFSFEAYSNISSNMDDGRVFDTLNGRINPFRVDSSSTSLKNYPKLATVCFITDTEDCSGYEFSNSEELGGGGGLPDGYDPDDDNRCIKEGYTIHSCPDGYVLGGLKCPYGDYYTECLIVCPDDYVTCNAPYSGYGEACDGKYAQCCQVCPPEYAYTEIPEGYVQDGEECFDCSGLTKYKIIEDTCDGYLDCGVVGGVEGAQTCVKGTTILYSECNECPNEGKLTTCPAHATCTYEECSGLWYIESCEDGYVLDSTGMKCEEEDLCKNVTCGANAYCSEGKCYCKDGFEGDPNTGCTKIDPCDNVTCGTNAYCSNGKCYCNNGFEGDPYTQCTPINNDPCEDVTCGANAYCANGSCYCNYGYEGNAYTGCTKSDPCDGVRCGSNAYCSNGSCYCYSGYEGNPYSGCTQSDPCDGVTCGANAHCSNGSCVCDTGYEGNPYSGCTKSDPCDDVTEVSVPANAHCTSYYSTCSTKCSGWACDSGYTKDGNSCKKVCTAETCSGYGLSTCPSHGNCSTCTPVNTDCSTGSTKYKLDSCESGYTKDGNSCKKVCTANSCSGYGLSTCPSHGNCSSCTVQNSDCSTGSTKYKLDSCESGYKLSGSSCVATCETNPCGRGCYTDNACTYGCKTRNSCGGCEVCYTYEEDTCIALTGSPDCNQSGGYLDEKPCQGSCRPGRVMQNGCCCEYNGSNCNCC